MRNRRPRDMLRGMALFKSADEKDAAAKANDERAFWESPVGQARLARERGDEVFQLAMPLRGQKAVIVPMGGALSAASEKDWSAELNDVVREGWDLVNGSVVFVQTGQESRDKFMASGQNVAISGQVVGYYLFKRRA